MPLEKSGLVPCSLLWFAVLAEERGATEHKGRDPTETMPFPDALLQAGWVAQVSPWPSTPY